MSSSATVDGLLVQWGERLFYPSNRIVRRRIEATVTGQAPQVMVKVTGGGRGIAAIAAHFRNISKNGRLEIEDDRGVVREGKEALHDLAEQWGYGGSLIDEVGHRREAINIMLSMPQGTDARLVQKAAREFALAELPGHRYVTVLHAHQANPHVHLSVRAESRTGKRLNPRKTDLRRWRETFLPRSCEAGASRPRRRARPHGARAATSIRYGA